MKLTYPFAAFVATALASANDTYCKKIRHLPRMCAACNGDNQLEVQNAHIRVKLACAALMQTSCCVGSSVFVTLQ